MFFLIIHQLSGSAVNIGVIQTKTPPARCTGGTILSLTLPEQSGFFIGGVVIPLFLKLLEYFTLQISAEVFIKVLIQVVIKL